MDCSLPGSSIHGIFQARVLEWGAIAFSGEALYWIVIGIELTQFLSINFSYFFFETCPLELLDSYIYYKPKHLNNIFGEVPS